MNDPIKSSRAVSAAQRRPTLQLWQAGRARSQSSGGLKARAGTGSETSVSYHQPARPRQPRLIRPARRTVHDLLLAAIVAHFGGSCVTMRRAFERPWASATFSGARHMFELAVELEGFSTSVFVLAGSLHEDQFELPGHIVADLDCRCETEGTKVTVMVEALTVEAV